MEGIKFARQDDPLSKELSRQVQFIGAAIKDVEPWVILPMYFQCHPNNKFGDKITTTINGVEIKADAVNNFIDDAMPTVDGLADTKMHYENIWNEIVNKGIITTTQQDDALQLEEEF